MFLARGFRQLSVVGDPLRRHFKSAVNSGLVPVPRRLKLDTLRWQELHLKQMIQLLKANKISEATTYFYEEVKRPSHNMYSVLLKAIGRTGHTRLAFKLFKDMRDRDMAPTPAILTCLFNACAHNDEQRGALEKAHHLYEQMKIHGWSTSGVTYHAMMKAFAMQGDSESCFRLLDEMPKLDHPVTIDTYNHLLMACVGDKKMGFVLAIRVFRLLLWKRIRPTQTTYNNLLRAAYSCGCGDDIHLLNKLLEDAQRSQLRDPNVAMIASGQNLLDVRLHNQLVAVAHVPRTPSERLALIGGPEGLLAQMSYFRVTPSGETFSELLKFYENEEELMTFVKSLDRESLDIGFWNQLLKRCIVSKYTCVDEVIQMIRDCGRKPDVLTFGIFAMAANSVQKAKDLIQEMEQRNMSVNNVIMSTLLRNAGFKFSIEMFDYLLEYCERNEIPLNDAAVRHLAVFLDANKRHSLSIHVQKFLHRLRVEPEPGDRLAQFEPVVAKRDRRRWDPEASEEELLALTEAASAKPGSSGSSARESSATASKLVRNRSSSSSSSPLTRSRQRQTKVPTASSLSSPSPPPPPTT